MISIIAAIAKNRAIGFENKLIYWLPNDLKRFKQLTTGHTVVMGRKTFESLPKGALPNRRNIVLSRQKRDFEGCDSFTSLRKALATCQPDEQVFIIGGASIYKEALAVADRLWLTEIDHIPTQADTCFPEIGEEWQETQREEYEPDERHAHRYAFVDYVRQAAKK